MAEEIFGEEFKGRGEEYRIILSKVFQKIKEIRKKNDQDILQKENLIVKINEELEQKKEENQKLEKNVKNCEKNMQEAYQNIISQQQNQVIFFFFREIQVLIKKKLQLIFLFIRFKFLKKRSQNSNQTLPV